MSKEKHDNSKHSKSHHVQQAELKETKVLAEIGASMPQRSPLMQQISRMANIPNPGAHAAILNRTKANQLSSNRQLLLQLQRQYGNSYVQRVMQQMQHTRELVPSASTQQPLVQAKLTIGEPGDKYEQEADKVARQVVQLLNAPASVESAQGQTVQRQAKDEDELMMKPIVQLQADTEMTAAPDLEASINQARGSGQPLADNIREPMEQAFGADFSRVRVHTDARADQLNQSIQAKAFTTEQDLFFRQGEYNPGSRGGQELIAHELTHVVQQSGGALRLSPLPQQSLLQYPACGNQTTASEEQGSKGQGLIVGKSNDRSVVPQEAVTELGRSKSPKAKEPFITTQTEKVLQRTEWMWTTSGSREYWHPISTIGQPTARPDRQGSFVGEVIDTSAEVNEAALEPFTITYDQAHGDLHFNGNPTAKKSKWSIPKEDALNLMSQAITNRMQDIQREARNSRTRKIAWILVADAEGVIGNSIRQNGITRFQIQLQANASTMNITYHGFPDERPTRTGLGPNRNSLV